MLRCRFASFAVLLGLLLPSCGKPVISSLSELSSTESIEPFVEPTGGSFDPDRAFKETEPADLYSLGLKENLDHLLPSYYRTPSNRSDGALDPFLGEKPNEIPTPRPYPQNLHRSPEHHDGPSSLFSEDAYTYVPDVGYYANCSSYSQGYFPCFYTVITAGNAQGAFIDAVYSHGCWSYIANFSYFGRSSSAVSDYLMFETSLGLQLLAPIVHCSMEDYPYTIYLDHKCVYFMTKNSRFPNDYIEEFNKCEDMHLLSGHPLFEGFSSSYLSKAPNSIHVDISEGIDPVGGSYDLNRSFKEEDPVDLTSLGFGWEFDEEYQPVSSQNGLMDPFHSKTPSQVDLFSSIENPEEQIASSKALFDDDIYYYIPHTALTVDYSIFSDGCAGPGFVHYDSMFFSQRSLHTVGLAWVDAVYSHGYWSYIANCNYNPFDQTVKGNMEAIFAAVLSKGGRSFFTQFNFDIYFDDHCVYFMKHYDAFPNDYIDEFNKRDDMHLLYRYTPSDQSQTQPPRPPM